MTSSWLRLAALALSTSAAAQPAPPPPPRPPPGAPHASPPPRPPAPPPPPGRPEPGPDEDDDDGEPGFLARADRDGEEGDEEGNRRFGRGWQPFRHSFDFGFDDEDEPHGAPAAHGPGSAQLAVQGTIALLVRAGAGDVEVAGTDQPRVVASLEGHKDDDVALYRKGDRVEVAVRGRRQLRRGKLRIEVPKGSRVEVTSLSGDVRIADAGDVRVRSLSGDLTLQRVGKVEVQSISGGVRIDGGRGPLRVRTVSGETTISTNAAAPQLDFQSASGTLDWTGLCAKDCRVSAETVSGEVRLALDPKSSFELSYSSHSGELHDGLQLAVKRDRRRRFGAGLFEGVYGKGEGVIEADAFSGGLRLDRK